MKQLAEFHAQRDRRGGRSQHGRTSRRKKNREQQHNRRCPECVAGITIQNDRDGASVDPRSESQNDRQREQKEIEGPRAPGPRRVHNQRCLRKNASMPTPSASIRMASHQNWTASPPGSRGNSTFMPNKPVRTVNGMKIVAMIVSTFMTPFNWFETRER